MIDRQEFGLIHLNPFPLGRDCSAQRPSRPSVALVMTKATVSGSDAYSPPQPSVRLLFSLLPRRDLYLVVLPAFILSMVAGVVAPFMTLVISNVSDTFAEFCRIPSPSSSDRANFKHDIAMSALELLFLAAGSLALGSLTSFLWILTGERNLLMIQQKVYASVSRREMAWFDAKMTEGADGFTGPGGLTAGFAKWVVPNLMDIVLTCDLV